jgi:drug/metabolite transporter (DMT)-like permease
MSLAFAGVVILARPHFDLSPHLVLVALLGAFSSACAMMFLRTLGPSETPEAVAAHFSLIATLASLAVAIPHLNWPGTTGALLLAGSGITAGLGQLLMTRAYGYDGAARLGALGYTGTALTQILAILFLAETPGPLQILGTTLVIGAGLMWWLLYANLGTQLQHSRLNVVEVTGGGLEHDLGAEAISP